jgi:NAD(P)-dependent dehydrogenase (short-subunit alcohol dehydrogenase family)
MTRSANLKGKAVIVTGAGRGIGADIAMDLAAAGCRIAICSRSQTELDEVVRKIDGGTGAHVRPYVCDLAQDGAAENMVAEALAAFGSIDVLVNNAATPGPFSPLEESPIEAWIHAINVNLLGVVRCCHSVLPHMKQQRRGKIINFAGASVGWGKFTPLQSAYVTSKFAVCGFTEALAREVAEFNIQVNAVSPGAVDTQLRESLLTAEQKKTDDKSSPALSSQPSVRLTSFLASEKSGPLTGRLLSAQWDDIDQLARDAQKINASSLYMLRKIDGRNFISSSDAGS